MEDSIISKGTPDALYGKNKMVPVAGAKGVVVVVGGCCGDSVSLETPAQPPQKLGSVEAERYHQRSQSLRPQTWRGRREIHPTCCWPGWSSNSLAE